MNGFFWGGLQAYTDLDQNVLSIFTNANMYQIGGVHGLVSDSTVKSIELLQKGQIVDIF